MFTNISTMGPGPLVGTPGMVRLVSQTAIDSDSWVETRFSCQQGALHCDINEDIYVVTWISDVG